MKSIFCMSAFVAAASATVGLIVPMYEYPTGTPALADWNALIAAVDAHPLLPFYVIINTANGPPFSPNPPSSMPDFAPWIDDLNSRSNAKAIGYIYTTQSTRDYAAITAGIDQYANWTTSAGFTTNATAYNIRLDGIFFDEVDTVSSKLTYNTNITNYAKASFASRGGPIVLNPGGLVQPGSESLFDIADSIVQIETCYTNSTGATDPGGVVRCPAGKYTPFTPELVKTVGNAAQSAKSSVVVHDFYETWSPFVAASLATLQTDIAATVSQAVHSLYFAVYAYTANFTAGPASITEVAAYTAQLQNLS